MTVRKYSSRAQQTTLATGISSVDTSMTVVSGSNVMGGKTKQKRKPIRQTKRNK